MIVESIVMLVIGIVLIASARREHEVEVKVLGVILTSVGAALTCHCLTSS